MKLSSAERRPDFVSVIIPCYNHGKYIHDAIESVLSQTCQNFEIIVVNDGSTDPGTVEILNNIDLPKTTVIHKENGGVASARNLGIRKSSGEFILTLDSDDMYAPTFLEKGLDVLKSQPHVGMVTSNVKITGSNRVSYTKKKGGVLEDFLKKNHASASLLFRYRCWMDASGYDEEIPGFEDWEFFLNVTKHGWEIFSIQEYLFYYRDLEGSMFDRVLVKRPEIIKHMVEKHKEAYRDHITDVIYFNEINAKDTRQLLQKYKESFAYRFGELALSPIIKMKGFLN